MKILSRIYTGLIFIFLYAPIVVLIVFSFNQSKSRSVWKGFSLRWYENLFRDSMILEALRTSLEVAVIAAIASTVIGTAAAVGLKKMNKGLRSVMLTLNNIPMVNPDIVTGISMMLLFVAVFSATGLLRPGFGTLVIAHITFCIPYVILSVLPKLNQMNPSIYEAAQDLGCPPFRAFMMVVAILLGTGFPIFFPPSHFHGRLIRFHSSASQWQGTDRFVTSCLAMTYTALMSL